MTKIELVKENSYLKLGIINLIEAMKDVRELRDIKQYLINLIYESKMKEDNEIDWAAVLKGSDNNEK